MLDAISVLSSLKCDSRFAVTVGCPATFLFFRLLAQLLRQPDFAAG